MTVALLLSTTALLCPVRLAIAPNRASLLSMVDKPPSDSAAWPAPARTVAELQEAEAKAKEAAEADAMANPKPFELEGGGFSLVALATVLVFVAGGSLFFQGIEGGGFARFADDQSPEVRSCIERASTRNEASACLPPVPIT